MIIRSRRVINFSLKLNNIWKILPVNYAMPESCEVEKIKQGIARAVSGRLLTSIALTNKSRYVKEQLKNFDELPLPMPFGEPWKRGKKIVIPLFHKHQVLNLQTQQIEDKVDDWYLVSFLATEGHWTWKKENNTAIILHINVPDGQTTTHDQSIVLTPNNHIVSEQLYYSDSMRRGRFDICKNKKELDKIMSTVGPDYLYNEVSQEMFLQACKKKTYQNWELCKFLMSQKPFSGIGNYLKAEILYKCKLRPDRLLGTLSEEYCILLYKTILEILQEAYLAGGLTIRTYWDLDGNMGKFNRKIYEKTIDPLGNRVIKSKFSDRRTSQWVPAVQM
jgi:formamidopyrimidine-DNA glycosylase